MEGEGYRTVRTAITGSTYKDKKSKFLGFVFPIKSREDIDLYLSELRSMHPAARHFCYAWRIGALKPEERANDDGEPHHTAGTPILGQITSFGLINVLVVVIRYFGGKKLGAGGLIRAYRSAARSALDEAELVYKEFESRLIISCRYAEMHKILRLIKLHNAHIEHQALDQISRFTVSVRKSELNLLTNSLNGLRDVTIEEF